jgi:hypothetical protein
MTQIIDQIVFLLSADWFMEKWYLLGMNSDLPTREAMKQKCRTIACELLDGTSDYWLVSFDNIRLERTYRDFFSATIDCKMDVSDVEILRQIADQTPVEITEFENTTLLKSLTELLVSHPGTEVDENLSTNIIETATSTYAATRIIDVDFVTLCLSSKTDWDVKLRNLTSGLPEYLADFATDICEQRHHFVRFWALLVEQISEKERKNLLQWYQKTALDLTKRRVQPPRWMKQ